MRDDLTSVENALDALLRNAIVDDLASRRNRPPKYHVTPTRDRDVEQNNFMRVAHEFGRKSRTVTDLCPAPRRASERSGPKQVLSRFPEFSEAVHKAQAGGPTR